MENIPLWVTDWRLPSNASGEGYVRGCGFEVREKKNPNGYGDGYHGDGAGDGESQADQQFVPLWK